MARSRSIRRVHGRQACFPKGSSTARKVEQLTHVIDTYFSGVDDLIALVIEPSMLRSPVRYEGAGDEKFPHVYGEIPVSAVTRVITLSTGDSFTNAT